MDERIVKPEIPRTAELEASHAEEIANKALEPKECDHWWGTRQGGFLVHCGKCGAIGWWRTDNE